MSDLTIKNVDLWNALMPLARNGKAPLTILSEVDLPAKEAYAITKILRKASNEFKDLDAARAKLVAKYAEKDADNRPIETEQGVQLKDAQAFHDEFWQLLQEPITLHGCWAIPVTSLGDAKIAPQVLNALDAFLTE